MTSSCREMHRIILITHWGRVTHLCVGNLTINGSDTGLSPAPSHYLNQCWNIVNWTPGNKLQWNLNRNLYIFIQENALENIVWKIAAILSRPQCDNKRPHAGNCRIFCFYCHRYVTYDTEAQTNMAAQGRLYFKNIFLYEVFEFSYKLNEWLLFCNTIG